MAHPYDLKCQVLSGFFVRRGENTNLRATGTWPLGEKIQKQFQQKIQKHYDGQRL
jgi:hypothetical protein